MSTILGDWSIRWVAFHSTQSEQTLRALRFLKMFVPAVRAFVRAPMPCCFFCGDSSCLGEACAAHCRPIDDGKSHALICLIKPFIAQLAVGTAARPFQPVANMDMAWVPDCWEDGAALVPVGHDMFTYGVQNVITLASSPPCLVAVCKRWHLSNALDMSCHKVDSNLKIHQFDMD